MLFKAKETVRSISTQATIEDIDARWTRTTENVPAVSHELCQRAHSLPELLLGRYAVYSKTAL